MNNLFNIICQNFRKHIVFSLIKALEFSIGVACCLIVLECIQEERSYDEFHKNESDKYQVVNNLDFGPIKEISMGCAYPASEALKNDFPEIDIPLNFGEEEKPY